MRVFDWIFVSCTVLAVAAVMGILFMVDSEIMQVRYICLSCILAVMVVIVSEKALIEKRGRSSVLLTLLFMAVMLVLLAAALWRT